MASKLFRNPAFLRRLRNLGTQKRFSHHDHHLSPLEIDVANRTTYNSLPQPKGSWQELNAKRQQINNTALIVGVLLFASAIPGTFWTGMWSDSFANPPVNKVSKDFPGAKFVDA